MNKLTYENFLETITDRIRSSLDENCTVENRRVLKNNSVELDSIMIAERDNCVAPSFYVNALYDHYRNGAAIESIVSNVINIFKENRFEMGTEEIGNFSYEEMKDKIVYKLVNYDLNKKMLEESPHLRVEDLAVTFHCIVKNGLDDIGSIRLTNEHIKGWNVTVQDLYSLAAKNTARIFPERLSDMVDLLKAMLSSDLLHMIDKDIETDFEDIDEDEAEERRSKLFKIAAELSAAKEGCGKQMYVLTNRQGVNGAACLLYPGLMESLAEKFGGDFYILPSSVNEVIIIEGKYIESEDELKDMVHMVNTEKVPEQEILSETVYHYPAHMFTVY